MDLAGPIRPSNPASNDNYCEFFAAQSILGRKLFKSGNYSRIYSTLKKGENLSFIQGSWSTVQCKKIMSIKSELKRFLFFYSVISAGGPIGY